MCTGSAAGRAGRRVPGGRLQHVATRCNTLQHSAPSHRIACARPAESNSGDRCSLRECAEQHALLQVVFMRGGQQAGMGGLGAGAGACSVSGRVFCARGARTRGLCGGEGSMWLIGEADCVEDDSRWIVRVGVAKGRRPEESGVRRQERPFADLKPNLCTNRELSRRSWH